MKVSYLVLLLVLCTGLFATPRGLTVREIPVSDVVVGVQPQVTEFITVPPIATPEPLDREEWQTMDYMDLDFLLPAKAQYGMQFNNSLSTGVPMGSMGSLLPESRLAIQKAPDWFRAELSGTLVQLTAEKQLIWANLINNAVDPYVDEIAFCVANSSPLYLNSSYALPEMFTENAVAIYAMAGQLPYVQVVDTGLSTQGGNYYSTTSYFKKNEAGVTVQVSVPREIYYWYIVHPKITDEIAAYIDPIIVENNSTHTNNIVAPPVGKFWRTYLYSLADGEYPVLSQALAECQTLFNRDGSDNDAIRKIQWWINQNMSFTSNNERPHQPVRIIAKRIGRCGEYADLTAACARLALIPCTSINSISTDHTWNEFWDENWVAWEPVNGYINDPLVYENGWGKVFGSVFETRSAGLFTPVTERYSQGSATIRIQVVDINLQPVDGARVVLAIYETTNRFDNEQYTDNEGFVLFTIGDNRNFRARVETNFALYPALAGTYIQLVENSVSGENYMYLFVLPMPLPQPALEQIPTPVDSVLDHRFSISYQSYGYYVTGFNLWDDIDILGPKPYHYKYVANPSNASFMVMDTDNLLFWQIDSMGSASNYLSPTSNGNATFDIPVGQDWFAFVDNSHRHRNAVQLTGWMVYERNGSSAVDEMAPIVGFELGNSYPNPFSSEMKLSLKMADTALLNLEIYNIKGQLVRSFPAATYKKGSNTLAWDAKDNSGSKVSSGIYFWRAQSGSQIKTSKMAVIR
ncbi:MAG: FlgD immunoglobulin-like domain containing protein [Candidatus Cloacimonetes bacterium]|nr:FlgD immunoglobulin-like domain containing protein [Candidatus Cloacimonadota bacterium]